MVSGLVLVWATLLSGLHCGTGLGLVYGPGYIVLLVWATVGWVTLRYGLGQLYGLGYIVVPVWGDIMVPHRRWN